AQEARSLPSRGAWAAEPIVDGRSYLVMETLRGHSMYSVVVPTFNRARNISTILESLLAQDTDLPYEIIVVDNNSSDETGAVTRVHEARGDGKLRYIFQREQGLSLARNAGIAAAKGEVIAFVDDD